MARKDADERWEKHLRALGMAVGAIQNCTHLGNWPGPVVSELRIKLEQDSRTSVLVVVKAHGEEGELVGFVGALDLETVVLTLAGKLKAQSLRWREDRPWPG